jgi:hypothetical protein
MISAVSAVSILRVAGHAVARAGRTLPVASAARAHMLVLPAGCRRCVEVSPTPCQCPALRRSGEVGPGHGASTANGFGVPMGDGGTSHATALDIPLRRCRRSVRSARGTDGRLPISARLRTRPTVVGGRRPHHRRGRTSSCRRPRSHLGSPPLRRSLTSESGCCRVQDRAVGVDVRFQAARSYSLISPPSTGRRLIAGGQDPERDDLAVAGVAAALDVAAAPL